MSEQMNEVNVHRSNFLQPGFCKELCSIEEVLGFSENLNHKYFFLPIKEDPYKLKR